MCDMSEEIIRFCNELLDWSCYDDNSSQCKPLGDNIWAVKSKSGVTLLKAENYGDAYSTYLDGISKIAEFLVERGKEADGYVSDEVTFEKTRAVSPEQIHDFDMRIRIIKGDLKYLAEKVNELSSQLEEQKIKGDKVGQDEKGS